MDAFTRGYLACALWTATTEDGRPLDATHDVDDFSPEAIAAAEATCKDFQETNAADLAEAYAMYPTTSDGATPEERAGHDLWLTRNGHGAGFWDRGLGDVGRSLTNMSRPYGEASVYVGDDGRLHTSEG